MHKEKECTLFDFCGAKTPVRTGCLTSCTWSPSSSSCRALYASLLLGSYFIGFFWLHVSHVYTGTIFNFAFVLSLVRVTFYLSLYLDRLAAAGVTICQLLLYIFALICSRATFRRVLQPSLIERKR